MPLIAQICMVIVTIALAGVAMVAIRLMLQAKALLQTANSSLIELPALIADVKQITRSARAGVSQFEGIATRSSTMASSLLHEVEQPISQLIGVIRGIRFGANYFIQRWKSRVGGRAHTKQGDDHVSEQRWLDDGGIPAWSSGRSRIGADFRTDGR